MRIVRNPVQPLFLAATLVLLVNLGAPAALASGRAPYLPRAKAKVYMKRALYHRVRGYRRGSGKRYRCRERVNTSTVRCFAAWVWGRQFYYAKVVAHRFRQRRGIGWWARYKVDRIDDRCYVRHKSRRRCSHWAWGSYRPG